MYKLKFQALGRLLILLIVLSSICFGDVFYSDLDPNADNYLDGGSSSKRWKDWWLAGTITAGGGELGSLTTVFDVGLENGNFDDDSVWDWGAGWSHDAVNEEADCVGPGAQYLTHTFAPTVGYTYQVTYTVKNFVSGAVRFDLGGQDSTAQTADGTYTESITATSTEVLRFLTAPDHTLSIDDVSIDNLGSITANTFVIGANTLNANEWAVLDGVDANMVIDWTADQGATNIDANNLAGTPAFAGLITGDVNVTGSGTKEALRINQGADSEGLEIYGYDNQDGNSIKIFIDSAGGANIQSSKYTVYKVGGNNVIVFNPTSFDVYRLMRMLDDVVQSFGTGKDYSWVYDEPTDTLQLIDGFTPGSNIRLQLDSSGNILVFNKLAFTQTDLNEYIDSLNDGYMDYGATTGHRFSGGLTVDTNTLVVDDVNDRVGIGTSSPNSVFHIKANFPGWVGNNYAGQIIIQNPADSVFSNAVITGYESDGSGNPDQQLWYLGSSSTGNSDIIFLNRRSSKLALGTSGTSRLTILGNGNVGIGTTTPAQKFDVNGITLLRDKLAFTQADLNEYIDSLADGYVDYGATTAHRFNAPVRSSTASYRRYYHLSVGGFDPGASGATWTDPSANTTGGWQLNAFGEKLIAGTDVHSDWDGTSDIMIEIHFALNDTAGGDPNVVLQLIAYYNGVGDTSTKTQTVEVITDTDGTQYKVYSVDFTLDYDATDNVIDAGDHITFILNLQTDTSEIDDIIVIEGAFFYNTTHLGIEPGDT